MGRRINKQLAWVFEGKLDTIFLTEVILREIKDSNQKDRKVLLDLVNAKDEDLDKTLEHFVNVILEEDTGIKDLVLFTPPILGKDWSRYDYIIDYYQSDKKDIDWIHGEVFSYSSSIVVTKNGKELNDKQIAMCLADIRDVEDSLKKEMEDLGLDFSRNLKEQVHQHCPKIIKIFLELCDKDIESYKLRPAIVTYWA